MFPNSLNLADVTIAQIFAYFDNDFSKYQCGFRKDCCDEHCPLIMSEKWKKSVNKGKYFGAL